MKATFAVLALLVASVGTAHAGMKYECWTYKGGSPDKMTYVVANNKNEAVQLAIAKFRDIGVTPNGVSCK